MGRKKEIIYGVKYMVYTYMYIYMDYTTHHLLNLCKLNGQFFIAMATFEKLGFSQNLPGKILGNEMYPAW